MLSRLQVDSKHLDKSGMLVHGGQEAVDMGMLLLQAGLKHLLQREVPSVTPCKD